MIAVLNNNTSASHFFLELMVLKIANMASVGIFFRLFLLKDYQISAEMPYLRRPLNQRPWVREMYLR
jgi:hypothetical protein